MLMHVELIALAAALVTAPRILTFAVWALAGQFIFALIDIYFMSTQRELINKFCRGQHFNFRMLNKEIIGTVVPSQLLTPSPLNPCGHLQPFE